MKFTIRKNVRHYFRNKELRVAAGVYEMLDSKIEKMLSEAMERAKKNGRTTVLEQDL